MNILVNDIELKIKDFNKVVLENGRILFLFEQKVNDFNLNDVPNSFSKAREYCRLNEISYIIKIDEKKYELYQDFFGFVQFYIHEKRGKVTITNALNIFFKDKTVINMQAISQYLKLGYITHNYCIINNTLKTFPGNIYKISCSKKIEKEINPSFFIKHPVNKTTISNALKRHIKNKRNVSLFLSGGFDSALLGKLLNKKKTDAYIYVDNSTHSHKELERAEKTASLLALNLHKIKLTNKDYDDCINSIINSLDEPVGSGSLIAKAIIAKIAKENGADYILEGSASDCMWGNSNGKLNKIQKIVILAKIIKFFNFKNSHLSLFRKIYNKYNELAIVNRYSSSGLTVDELEYYYHSLPIQDYSIFNKIHVIKYLTRLLNYMIPSFKAYEKLSGISVIAPFIDKKVFQLSQSIKPSSKYKRDKAILKDFFEKSLQRENYDDQQLGGLFPYHKWIIENKIDIVKKCPLIDQREIEELCLKIKYDINDMKSGNKLYKRYILAQWYMNNFYVKVS